MAELLIKSTDTMLARMFDPENRAILQKDKKGEYLIDRNGRAFEGFFFLFFSLWLFSFGDHFLLFSFRVLEFLRTGRVFLAGGVTEDQLAIEFDYFQVSLNQKEKNTSSFLMFFLLFSFQWSRSWGIEIFLVNFHSLFIGKKKQWFVLIPFKKNSSFSHPKDRDYLTL